MRNWILFLLCVFAFGVSCASKKVMKDCKPVDQSWFICDTP